MNSNSDNPKVGKTFQLVVKEWFEQARKVSYQMEKAIPKQVGKFSRHKALFINPLFDGLILSPFLCYSYREKTVQAIERRENRMKILFIGNSHTFVHYVPARVAHFCLSHGKPVETTMLTHPGMGLDWHLEQSQTYYNLLYGRYDAVVLQHNAHPFPGRELLLTAGQRIISLLPEETKPYLYMTWTEKNNPQGQETMSAAYEELGKLTGAVVCPVGRVWQAVRAAHPEEELYFADGEHSSVLGASLAGAVIGRTLLGMEVSPDLCYEDAKVLETLSMDPRMIDLAMEGEKLTMAPIGELMDQ